MKSEYKKKLEEDIFNRLQRQLVILWLLVVHFLAFVYIFQRLNEIYV